MVKKKLLIVLAVVVFGGAATYVWSERVGTHRSVPVPAVEVSLRSGDRAELLVNSTKVVIPHCNKVSYGPDVEDTYEPDGDLNVTVGPFEYSRNFPILEKCRNESKYGRSSGGLYIKLPPEWASTPATHDITINVMDKPNVLRLTNDGTALRLATVNAPAVTLESAELPLSDVGVG